jgi:hypothetical protein
MERSQQLLFNHSAKVRDGNLVATATGTKMPVCGANRLHGEFLTSVTGLPFLACPEVEWKQVALLETVDMRFSAGFRIPDPALGIGEAFPSSGPRSAAFEPWSRMEESVSSSYHSEFDLAAALLSEPLFSTLICLRTRSPRQTALEQRSGLSALR